MMSTLAIWRTTLRIAHIIFTVIPSSCYHMHLITYKEIWHLHYSPLKKQSVWFSPSTFLYPVHHYCLWMAYRSGWYSLRHFIFLDGATLRMQNSYHLLYTWHACAIKFVFTTKFEMLSAFIAGQEVLTLGAFHRYEHCKHLSDTLWTRNLMELVPPMNKFVTSICNTIKLALLCVLYFDSYLVHRNVLKGHCMLNIVSLDTFIS